MAITDTNNYQFVGSLGPRVTCGVPLPEMTPGEAMLHAAWLVSIAEITASVNDLELAPFEDYLTAVRAS